MVFFIIAAAQKDRSQAGVKNLNQQVQYVPENQMVAAIRGTKSFTMQPGPSEIHPMQVDKTIFKIGSLDQLMQMNEQAAKLDTQVDMACKKYEKIAFDSGATELRYTNEQTNEQQDYKDYIKKWTWNGRKYNQRMPLHELCAAFLKTLQMQDSMLKKHQDSLNAKKLKLSMMQRKEGGNLTVRDYTDDIYNRQTLTKKHFVEGLGAGAGSELFTNLLIVVQANKFNEMRQTLSTLMTDYYEQIDAGELRRVEDMAKTRLNDMREHEEEWKRFITKHELMGEQDKDWELRAHQCVVQTITDEIKHRRDQRMRFVIVPDEPLDMGITDKEGNCVYRLFVYKAQAEDAMKALRRKGVTSRMFSYDKEVWEKENQQRAQLKDECKNLTETLMRAAVGSFQQLFAALMHLKVVRAYIDGVLRFGIPPKFYIGIVMPRKGCEKSILTEMTDVLAEPAMKEMYGEKQDANDNEDYWPFVCVTLTSPNFMHVQKE